MKTSIAAFSDTQFITVSFNIQENWDVNELKFFTIPFTLPQGSVQPISASIAQLSGTCPSHFLVYFNGFSTDNANSNNLQVGVKNISGIELNGDLLGIKVNVMYH